MSEENGVSTLDTEKNSGREAIDDSPAKVVEFKRFTKKDVLAGADDVEDCQFPNYEAVIPLRRLTSGEWGKVEEIQSGGVTIEGEPELDEQGNAKPDSSGMNMHIDVPKSVASESLARHYVVAKGLSVVGGEKWTVEEAEGIPNPGLVREIHQRVVELSGATSAQGEAIKKFREQPGGAEHSDDESAGVSTSQ